MVVVGGSGGKSKKVQIYGCKMEIARAALQDAERTGWMLHEPAPSSEPAACGNKRGVSARGSQRREHLGWGGGRRQAKGGGEDLISQEQPDLSLVNTMGSPKAEKRFGLWSGRGDREKGIPRKCNIACAEEGTDACEGLVYLANAKLGNVPPT